MTTEEHISFAVKCAKKVCHLKYWHKWSDNWLSEKDRTVKSSKAIIKRLYGKCDEHDVFRVAAAGAAEAAHYFVSKKFSEKDTNEQAHLAIEWAKCAARFQRIRLHIPKNIPTVN